MGQAGAGSACAGSRGNPQVRECCPLLPAMHTCACTCTHTHTYTYSYTHTHTRAHTHTHTRTHTHVHRHTPAPHAPTWYCPPELLGRVPALAAQSAQALTRHEHEHVAAASSGDRPLMVNALHAREKKPQRHKRHMWLVQHAGRAHTFRPHMHHPH